MEATVGFCNGALERWRFNDYVGYAYRFFRDDLCDWYLEWSKRQFRQGGDVARDAANCLAWCFDRSLHLLHPGMPFITEHLWQLLQEVRGGTAWQRTLMLSRWPEMTGLIRGHDALQERMAGLQGVVTAVRNVRNLVGLADGVQVAVVLDGPAELAQDAAFLTDRGNLSALTINAGAAKPPQSVTTVVGALKVHIPLAGLTDLGKLKAQLDKRAQALAKSIGGKEGRLGNADYLARAPAEQVAETRAMLEAERVELANLRETLATL